MLTHPGTSIIPARSSRRKSAARRARTSSRRSSRRYEVMERLAADFIPTVMARGFHPSPVFGIFGAAIAAAKIMRLDEDQMNSTIALCASLAARQSRRRAQRRQGAARRRRGAQRDARGRARAARARRRRDRARRRRRLLSRLHRQQPRQAHLQLRRRHARRALDKITADLGKDWMFLETLYRIYSIAGYNIAHIDVTAAALQGARHQARERRARRSGGELARDAVPEPGLPGRREDAAAAKPGSTRLLHRLWRR